MNKLEAIIYRVQAYKENDKLIFTYSNKGKINLVARGSQRVNSDLRIKTQYLSKISFEYTNFKTLMTLNRCILINDYSKIKESYNNTKSASLIFEIINKCYIDDLDHNIIYNLLIESLESNNLDASTLSFAMKLTYYLGYGLDLKGNGKKIKGLSIDKGSVVYEDEGYSLDLDYHQTLILLKLTYSKISELEVLEKETIEVLKDFIYKLYYQKIEIKLNVLK